MCNRLLVRALLLALAMLAGLTGMPRSWREVPPGSPVPKTIVVRSMDRIAESYVRLALAVGEHDPLYVDAYYGPAEWRTRGARGEEAARGDREGDGAPSRGARETRLFARGGDRPAPSRLPGEGARVARRARTDARGREVHLRRGVDRALRRCGSPFRRFLVSRRCSRGSILSCRLERARSRSGSSASRRISSYRRTSSTPSSRRRSRRRAGERWSTCPSRERVIHGRVRHGSSRGAPTTGTRARTTA